MVKLRLLFVIFLLTFVLYSPQKVLADFSLTGSSSLNATQSVALPISDLQLTGTGTEPVNVKLRVTSGSLAMTTTTGLTFDGASSGSTIYFSGTQANLNAALATLTYTRSTTGSDTLEVSLVPKGEVFFTDNGHLYKFISGTINPANALTQAATLTAYGATGYLVTITSQAENDFVAARLTGDGWMAANDQAVEGTWKWVAGPESGTTFWQGLGNGSTVGGNYANWASGEPNNSGNNEDCGQFYVTTGKWNDLPCSNTLSGYVVEFGAPGNLPNVVAKNIAITTSNVPTVNSFSPADNATGITLNSNLVLTFSQTVTKGTGSILIKKTSDDSTLETIDVTSSAVTGGGTSTITIDPATSFIDSTYYYITIPNTAFKNGSNNFYAGISNNSTWNFTTGDFTAPIISAISSSPTSSGATITWTTNENASTKVQYGLTASLGTTTSETDTSPRVTSHSKTISSLLPCTTYYYRVVSTDGSTNTVNSSVNTFTTTGCTVDTPPVNTSTSNVTVSSGGTTQITQNSTQLSVIAPTNFTNQATSVVIQINAVEGDPILNSIGRPADVPTEVGNIVFDVKAIINSTTVLDSFDAPVTLTYQYSDADVQGLDESSLWLHHYHNGAWSPLTSCTIDKAINTISCTTDSFSIFGLFGRAIAEVTPTTAPAPNTGSPSTTSGVGECSAIKPAGTPDLFQIDVTDTKATLYFTPLTKNVTNYYISYGYKGGEERFGTFTGLGAYTGVLSYTINELNPNTTYYFKIRPQNQCAPGDWGNEMKATTVKKNSTGKKFYKNIVTQIMNGFFPKEVSNLNQKSKIKAQAVKTIKQAKTCEYTVKPTDNLWDIATNELGNGNEYRKIMEDNNLSSNALKPGMKLTLGC